MINNVNIFAGFHLSVFENKRTFVKKKCVLHTTILMQSKARQCLRDLFSNNQGNSSEMTYFLLKPTSKI